MSEFVFPELEGISDAYDRDGPDWPCLFLFRGEAVDGSSQPLPA